MKSKIIYPKIFKLTKIFAVFCFFLITAFFLSAKNQPQISPVKLTPKLHYSGREDLKISEVAIKAVYFAPKDRKPLLDTSWRDPANAALKETADFYSRQLKGAAKINFEIYPETVIGKNLGNFYDGEDTKNGNPHALISIRQELEERLFKSSGDLYIKTFSAKNIPVYTVLAVIYEGVGSGGTLAEEGSHLMPEGKETPALLISRSFLTEENYQDYGTTFLAHELGHTLGLKDNYDTSTGFPFSEDIMGSGRFLPLNYAFILPADKAALGLIE